MTGLEPSISDEAASPLQWRRVHPATPLVRMWVALVALALFTLREVDELVSGGYREILALAVSWTAWAVLVGVIVVILTGFYISWRCTGYAVDDERIHFKQGVVWRTERTAPLDKVETIDVRRPLAARLIGLSQLRIEVAGGKDSYLELGFLRLADANVLRDELLTAAKLHDRRPEAVTTPEAGIAAEHSSIPVEDALYEPSAVAAQHVLTIPNSRLFAAALLSGEFVTSVGVVIGGVIAVVITGSFATLAGVAALLWGFGGGAVKRFTRNFGFVVTKSDQGLRIGRGLFDHTMQSVPTERIHAIEVRQTVLHRLCQWWQIRATIAGYGEEGDETMLVPVATSDEVLNFLAHFGARWTDEQTIALLVQGMAGDRHQAGDVFQAVPQRARLWDPLGWVRQGHWADDDQVWLRHGRLQRAVSVIELAHCQSASVVQGPLDRKRSLASVEFGLVSGPVSKVLDHLDESVAVDLAERLVAEDRRFRANA